MVISAASSCVGAMSAGLIPPFKFERTHEAALSVPPLEQSARAALSDVRSAAHYGLNSDIELGPKSAIGLNRSRGRALRRAAWPCQQWIERWERVT